MNKILMLCASLMLTYTSTSYACMNNMDVIQDSWKLASTKKTFSTTGCILSQTENKTPLQFSGVLIDPWTVLTCGHELVASKTGSSAYFSLTPDVALSISNDTLNFAESVNMLDSTQSSAVANVILHPDFKMINSQDGQIRCEEPDIAILKLVMPLHIHGDFLTISEAAPIQRSSRRGFALGYYRFAHTFDGKKRVLKTGNTYLTTKLVLEENHVEFKSLDQTFGSMHLSPTGSMDTCVVQPGESKYSGLIQNGMSGGPILAQNQETKKFEIVGINSRVFNPDIEPNMHVPGSNKPVFNVWSSVFSAADWIKAHMGETQLSNEKSGDLA